MSEGVLPIIKDGCYGGISDDKFAGIKQSFQDGQSIEIRKFPKSIKLGKALAKDSGSVVTDLINCAVTLSSNGNVVAFGNAGCIYTKDLGGTWKKVYTMASSDSIIGACEYNQYVYRGTRDKLHRTDLTSIDDAISSGTLTPTNINWKTLNGLSYSNGLTTSYILNTSTKQKVGERIYAKRNYSLTDVGVSNGTTAPTKAYLEEAPDMAAIAFSNQRLYTSSNVNPTDLTVTPTWTERRPLGDTNIDWKASAVSADGLKMIVSGTNTNLWKSTDGGVNWTEIPCMSGGALETQTIGYLSTGTGGITTKHGIAITPEINLRLVSVHAFGSGPTKAYLQDNSGTELANATITAQTATFNYNLTAGVTYRIVGDNNGNAYLRDSTTKTFPDDMGYVDLVSGIANGSIDTGNVYIFDTMVIQTPLDQFDNISMSGDGTKIIASKYGGRVFVSTDSGANFSETSPISTSDVTDAHGVSLNIGDGTQSYKTGVEIQSIYTGTLKTIKTHASCNATKAYLYASTGTTIGALLDTQNITSNIATFNYSIVAGNYYYILVDNNGSTYNQYYNSPSTSVPIVKTNVKYTGGYQGSGSGGTLCSVIEVKTAITSGDANRKISKISQDGSTYMVGVYGGRLYTSTNGSSWTERQPEGNSNHNRMAGFVNYDGTKILAGKYITNSYLQYNVYKSLDSGATWSNLPRNYTNKDIKIGASNNLSMIMVIGNEVNYSVDYGTNRSTSSGITYTATSISYDYNGQVISASTPTRLYKSLDGGATFTERQPAGNNDKTWKGIVLSAGAIPLETVSVSVNKATFSTTLTAGKYYNILFDKEGTSRDPSYKVIAYPQTKTDINYLYGMKNYRDATNGYVITSIGASVTNAVSHPMITSNTVLYIGDGQYVATVDKYGVFTGDRLVFPELDKIVYITYNNAYIRFYCDQGTNRDTGIVYFWDGIQDNPDQKQELPGKFRCATLKDNVDYAILGFDPILFYYPYQRQALKRIANMNVSLNGMISYKNYILFGVNGGLYSRGNFNKDYPEVLNIEYKTSNGNDTDDIGAIFNANGDLYVSWKNGSTYGIDKLGTSYTTTGYITAKVFSGTEMRRKKNTAQLYITHEPLISGQTIQIYTKKDLTGSWILQDTLTSTTGNCTMNRIRLPQEFNELEVKLVLNGPGSSTPEIYECMIRFQEQDV